ncbi:hypothetical protein AAFF_G00098170, partial [Aldrovandia affinis]
MSGGADFPESIEGWTKEHVRQWLLSLRVPQEYTDRLYNEDISGASLICFEKQDLLDLGIKHGPAVQIISNARKLKQSSARLHRQKIKALCKDDNRAGEDIKGVEEPLETTRLVSCNTVSHPDSSERMTASAEVESSTVINKEEVNSNLYPACTQDIPGGGRIEQASENLQSLKCKDITIAVVDTISPPIEQCKGADGNPTGLHETQGVMKGSVTQALVGKPSIPPPSHALEQWKCLPRPFDKSSTLHIYTQNHILPRETGPSNLRDPVHEYKLLAKTADATESEVLRKFSNEVLRFAAACMNSRTNGTIHFGVGDAPEYTHGQVIGINV